MSPYCPACRSPIGADAQRPTCDPDGHRSLELPQSTSQQKQLPASVRGDVQPQRYLASTRRAKLLAVRQATVASKPVVVLTVRIGTLSLSPTNLTLTAAQARRRLIDLTQMFSDAELRDAARLPDHKARAAFDRIMQDEPRSTVGRSEEPR